MLSIAIGVFISPGMIALTRMLYLALPVARQWVIALSAAFDTLYANRPDAQTAAIDDTLMIEPAFCSRIAGSACLTMNHGPLRFTSMMRSKFSSLSDAGPLSP